jgi:hypothetical protein
MQPAQGKKRLYQCLPWIANPRAGHVFAALSSAFRQAFMQRHKEK